MGARKGQDKLDITKFPCCKLQSSNAKEPVDLLHTEPEMSLSRQRKRCPRLRVRYCIGHGNQMMTNTLVNNRETATHIGIREAEDWFRPIDLAKECDIYISSRSGSHKEIPITYGYTQDLLKIDHKTLNQRLKRTIPNILKEKIKIALY
ncbi:hypothetical protein TNCV_2989211 [Trichonephila clavipes]|nr:hypothetical protein TNCV_2989211 [Trichonephila clavipes]